MKRLIFIVIFFIAFFSVNALAGYPESSFQSMHQPDGLMNSWKPGGSSEYLRAGISYPSGKRFKLFIPPSAKNLNVISFVGQGKDYVSYFIARLGQPPDATSIPNGAELKSEGFTPAELSKGDCFGRNSAGYIIYTNNYGPVNQGQWLYVHITHSDGTLISVQSYFKVDPSIYAAWYNSALFGSDGDPSPAGVPPSPKPTPAPTPISTPVPTPTGGPGCDPFTCSNAGGRCVNNVCVYPTPTPTAKPTPKPTPIPSEGCNVLFCTLSGGHCVGNICVPNSPTPTPAPVVDVYQGSASGVPITIRLTHETDTTGTASITVGDNTAPGIPYKIWEHDNIKTVYILDVGYLEIVGQTMRIDTFSGIVLNKK
jgi:hypothetical protein